MAQLKAERLALLDVLRCMDEPEDKSRSGDVKAWVTIALIDVAATAAVCGLYLWLSGATS